jgi:hypothetical protein
VLYQSRGAVGHAPADIRPRVTRRQVTWNFYVRTGFAICMFPGSSGKHQRQRRTPETLGPGAARHQDAHLRHRPQVICPPPPSDYWPHLSPALFGPIHRYGLPRVLAPSSDTDYHGISRGNPGGGEASGCCVSTTSCLIHSGVELRATLK